MGETEDPTPADQSAKKEQPAIKSNVHLEIEEPISIDQIVIPVLSPEQTACCGNGIPLSEITSGNDEKILVPRKEVGMLCDGKMPFAIIADGESMKKWGIRSGSRVVINPVEELHDFDIALVCYKDNLVLKKLRRMRDGSIELISADGSIITVPADDACVPDLFAIWGKAMTYTYKESGKVKHGL
ncbi:S24 family peptidase [Caenicola nitritireducens]|nr:S24 family peptidase [Synergistaceae bacterium DZ-S4]